MAKEVTPALGQAAQKPDDLSPPPDTVVKRRREASHQRAFFALRSPIPLWQGMLLAVLCLAACGGVWWWLTRGVPPKRIYSREILPSPAETFGYLADPAFRAKLALNTYASLRRVVLGFGLAALIGVPLGILCGCFRRAHAFFLPLTIFGRNIPVAALIPLTFAIFGIEEFQKVVFIFIACVPFIISDAATAIADVRSQYIDTAYTLGARPRQIVLKVLVPLAMPGIFNSLRLLFGLAFGYIMLVESVQTDNQVGLGGIINMAEGRGGQYPHILVVLMVIPVVALLIDLVIYWVQRQLFPYQYGGAGILHLALRAVLRAWDDLKTLVLRRKAPAVPPTTPGGTS
jgi:ABC-type nitrate/sulfonate/bicarbonate transport system permease component